MACEIAHVLARELRGGDVLADPPVEVYSGAPGGPFVEYTRVVSVEDAHLRGAELGPGAKDEHEIRQVRIITRRYGEGPPECEVEDDGAELGSERELILRHGSVVAVIRGDLAELCR